MNYRAATAETTDLLFSKRVKFAFHGARLEFDLARTLFASAGIDTGSALLLRHMMEAEVGQHDQKVDTVLDLGSGHGVLGVVFGALDPQRSVTFGDRDALAVDYSARNARLNGLGDNNVTTVGTLGLDGINPPVGGFDLVMSNIPGKIGAPAIAELVMGAAKVTRLDGYVAFVVVDPLVDCIEELLGSDQFGDVTTRSTKAHTAFTARVVKRPVVPAIDEGDAASSTSEPQSGFDRGVYDRDQADFRTGKLAWKATTVNGIDEFDSLGYATTLLASAFENLKKGPVVVVNPGQGHRAIVAAQSGRPVTTVVGRDLLGLHATARMIRENGAGPEPELVHTAEHPSGSLQNFDSIVAVIVHTEDKVQTPDLLAQANTIIEGLRRVEPHPRLIITGRASNLGRLEAELVRARTARVEVKISKRGWRVLRLAPTIPKT